MSDDVKAKVRRMLERLDPTLPDATVTVVVDGVTVTASVLDVAVGCQRSVDAAAKGEPKRCIFCQQTGVHECRGGMVRMWRRDPETGERWPDGYMRVSPGKVDADAYYEGDPQRTRLWGGYWDAC